MKSVKDASFEGADGLVHVVYWNAVKTPYGYHKRCTDKWVGTWDDEIFDEAPTCIRCVVAREPRT